MDGVRHGFHPWLIMSNPFGISVRSFQDQFKPERLARFWVLIGVNDVRSFQDRFKPERLARY